MKINTIPNWITLARFIMYLVTVGILLGGNSQIKWVALPLYVTAFLMDKLDGYVARKFNQITDIGKFFDLSTDRAIVTTMLIMYLYFHQSLAILVLVVANLIRDFMVAGLRQLAGMNKIFLQAHILGKLKFITENLSAITMVLWLSIPMAAWMTPLIHKSILWILVAGTIFGWGAFCVYCKQVLAIKK